MLSLWGIPTPRGGVATSASAARALAARLRPPLALKVVARELLHKSDAGGVELGVVGDDAERLYGQIIGRVLEKSPGLAVEGVLIEEMVSSPIEVVASVSHNPQLGLVLMAGMGGRWVEILRDVSFRLVPVDRDDVVEMVRDLRAAPLLAGARGSPAVNEEALFQALAGLSEFAQEFTEEIFEVEINPMAVSPDGVSAVDAVILLRSET